MKEAIYISGALERKLSAAQKPEGMDDQGFAELLIARGLEKLAREDSRRQKKSPDGASTPPGRINHLSRR